MLFVKKKYTMEKELSGGTISLLCLTAFIAGIIAEGGHKINEETQLFRDLMKTYKQPVMVGRPVYNISDMLTVSFGLSLTHIMDLDEHQQLLTAMTVYKMMWHDAFLRWNPEDYGGIDSIQIPVTGIWIPDVTLYNGLEEKQLNNIHNNNIHAVVVSNGVVSLITRNIIKSACEVDLTYFPLDTQVCKLKYISWSYHGLKLDIKHYLDLEQIDVTDYVENKEWKIVAHPAKKSVKYYPCCDEPYPSITYEIHLERVFVTYQFSIILPATLITVLSIFIFIIPPNMDSKINLGIFVFVGHVVLLLYVSSILPATTNRPNIIVWYLSAGLSLITIAIILSTLTMNIAKIGRRGVKLPTLITKICNTGIGCVMCMCTVKCGQHDNQYLSQENTERDWETFAQVLDRIFMIIYSILIGMLSFSVYNIIRLETNTSSP